MHNTHWQEGSAPVNPGLTLAIPSPRTKEEPQHGDPVMIDDDLCILDEDVLRRDKQERFAQRCSQILPFLCVSGYSVAQDEATLREAGVAAVVNCAANVCDDVFSSESVSRAQSAADSVHSSTESPHHDGSGDVQSTAPYSRKLSTFSLPYLSLYLMDGPTQEISPLFPLVTLLVEQVRQGHVVPGHANEQPTRRPSVLIHCHRGVSRSGTFAIAYLMWALRCSLDTAVEAAREMRSIISPNAGFLGQLLEWEEHIQAMLGPRDALLSIPRTPGDSGWCCIGGFEAEEEEEVGEREASGVMSPSKWQRVRDHLRHCGSPWIRFPFPGRLPPYGLVFAVRPTSAQQRQQETAAAASATTATNVGSEPWPGSLSSWEVVQVRARGNRTAIPPSTAHSPEQLARTNAVDGIAELGVLLVLLPDVHQVERASQRSLADERTWPISHVWVWPRDSLPHAARREAIEAATQELQRWDQLGTNPPWSDLIGGDVVLGEGEKAEDAEGDEGPEHPSRSLPAPEIVTARSSAKFLSHLRRLESATRSVWPENEFTATTSTDSHSGDGPVTGRGGGFALTFLPTTARPLNGPPDLGRAETAMQDDDVAVVEPSIRRGSASPVRDNDHDDTSKDDDAPLGLRTDGAKPCLFQVQSMEESPLSLDRLVDYEDEDLTPTTVAVLLVPSERHELDAYVWYGAEVDSRLHEEADALAVQAANQLTEEATPIRKVQVERDGNESDSFWEALEAGF